MARQGGKQGKKKFYGAGAGRPAGTAINAALAAKVEAALLMMLENERMGAQTLEAAFAVLAWADQLVGHFETVNALPQPIVCQPGCHYCCYQQVELTPLEASLLGHYVQKQLPAAAQDRVKENAARAVALKAGKSKPEIARRRRELPCPLLFEGRCAAYAVRPLVCRAMHSLSLESCEAAFRSTALLSVPHYAHRHEIILSLSRGVTSACGLLGCQAGSLDLAQALEDCARTDQPVAKWLRGERVFRV